MKHKMSKGTVLFILFGITVPIINLLVTYVYPNFSSVVMAFQDKNGSFSFANFARFFDEFSNESSQINEAFRNTFITFLIGLVVYPLHVLTPYFIYKKVPFSGFYKIAFFLPSIIFSVAVGLIFKQLVGIEGFIAKSVQDALNLSTVPELLADSRFANYVIWAHLLWITFPGELIIWGGTFARIPDSVLESGKIDGANWWTEFSRIVVPMVWPTVGLQMVLMVCGVFGASGAVFLLTDGQYGTMTLSTWMYKTVLDGAGDIEASTVYNYLSAVGLMLTSVAVPLSLFVRKIADKAFDEVEF